MTTILFYLQKKRIFFVFLTQMDYFFAYVRNNSKLCLIFLHEMAKTYSHGGI